MLKGKVAGTSIKNECPSDTMTGTMYKTNSALVHQNPGTDEVIPQSMRDEQRLKLSRANFTIGASPNFYDTNNKLAFYPMRGAAHSQDQRA